MKIDKKHIAIGAGVGLLTYFLWPKETQAAVSVIVTPAGDDFEKFQGLTFWSKSSLPRVKQALGSHGITPFGRSDLPQAAVMADSAPSGGDSALNWVIVKQQKGWFVGVSDDLLRPKAGIPINIVAAAQDIATARLAFGDPESHWAVLPPLAGT